MRKTAVITGASRGIGRASAVELAKAGFDVIINFKENEEAADKTVSACAAFGAKALKFRADIKSEDKVRRMFAFAECELGGVDVLVNNAGVAAGGLFTDMTRADYDKLFDVNVWGLAVCAREAAKIMVRAQSGKIINISSMWGIVGSSCEALYSASKAAVIGLTKALAKELAPSHVNVNCIAPGVIDTDMNVCYDADTMRALANETPLGRIGSPEDVAKAVAFLAGEGGDFITGETIRVDGGFTL